MMLCLLISAGCTTAAKPVVVEPKTIRLKVPAPLLVKCPDADNRSWKTTRDIIATATANGAALATCSSQVDAIRSWNSGQ